MLYWTIPREESWSLEWIRIRVDGVIRFRASGYVWKLLNLERKVYGFKSIRLRVDGASMGYFCCGRSGVRGSCLIVRRISFQNFRSLKLGLYFCEDFLTSSELIVYIDLPEYYEICAKMFLDYQCEKGFEAFLIFQILLLLSALMWRRSANIQFANFKIDFLVNNRNIKKASHHFVVYQLVIDIVQFVWSDLRAGRQVIQFNKKCQFCVGRLARAYHYIKS